jgi:hypothetical protein
MKIIRKIETGIYEFDDDTTGITWSIMNIGYTRGYACVMWRASTRRWIDGTGEVPLVSAHWQEIYDNTMKGCIEQIKNGVYFLGSN